MTERGDWIRALVALALVLALGLVFNADGSFFQWTMHRDVFRQISVYGILACGMTLVVITGGIDLAVGSLLGLAAVLFSWLTLHRGWEGWSALMICVGTGAFLGGVSGTLISIARFQPFIATLAMMVLSRGIAKSISGGQKISTAVQGSDGSFQYRDLPPVFDSIDHRIFGDNLAVVSLIFFGSCIFCAFLLSGLRIGRYWYAIGGNEEAAQYSGVPTRWAKLLAYGISGGLSAIAGICQAAQEKQGDPEAGVTYELTAIAMVVIGGTSLNGGRGGITLTFIGVIIIGYLEKILSINAVGESSRLMLTAAIIIAAVFLQKIRSLE